jgi:hypothetical protein
MLVDIVTPSVGIRDFLCGSRQKFGALLLKAFTAGWGVLALHVDDVSSVGCELNLIEAYALGSVLSIGKAGIS